MRNPQDILAPLLASASSVWVVVETKLHKFYLTQNLAGDFPQVNVVTRGELYRSTSIVRRPNETVRVSLSELCLRTIAAGDFPILSEEIDATGSLNLAYTFRALTPIVEFVESYLCYDADSDIYGSLVDEFGDIKSEAERLGELVRLADIVSAEDGSALLNLPQQLTAEGKLQIKSLLPEQLIFYRPTHFVPLERHFLVSISGLTAITFVTEQVAEASDASQIAPSERFLGATQKFIGELEAAGKCRHVTIATDRIELSPDPTAILDGRNFSAAKGCLDNISIVEIDGSEVAVVSDLVAGIITATQCPPSDIVVVALQDNFGNTIKKSLRERGIAVVNPRGRLLSDTPFPALFRSFIEWLVQPSITTFENLYLSPQLPGSSEVRLALGLIRVSGLASRIFGPASESGITQSIRSQLISINELSGSMVEPDVLARGLTAIDQHLTAIGRSLSSARKHFSKLRLRLPQLVLGLSDLDRKEVVRALRSFSSLLRREQAALEPFFGRFDELELLRAYEQRVRSASASTYLNEEVEPTAVVVTELLDARSLENKIVIIANSVETNFFGGSGEFDGSVTSRMDQRLKRSIGAELPGAEALAILRSLLTNSRKLFFTYSKSDGAPPRFVERLSKFSSRDVSGLDQLIATTRTTSALTKGAELLLSRGSSTQTAFDGLISAEGLDRSGFVHEYSVSEIQTLADCPHKFFFARFLALTELNSSPGGFFARLGGTLIHNILSLRFQDKLNIEQFFANYDLPWDLPEYQQLRRVIVHHYLPTAERISQHLGTQPILFEERFGRDKPLRLESDRGPIIVRGAIDRVDLLEEREGRKLVAVWDYKTSAVNSLERRKPNREIQIPLYALALKATGKYDVVAGGLLLLDYPGLEDDDFDDITGGPIRDQLRLSKPKTSWTIDPASVEDKLTNITQKVRELAEKVSAGQLVQSHETHGDVCKVCEFQLICARDEVVLEQTYQGLPISVRSEPKAPTNNYKLYFDRYTSIEERRPSPPQQRAGDTAKSFVVHAGAGAGKTATIVHRILTLLLAGNPIDSIVTVTFTKKAAAELKQRLKLAIAGAIERRGIFGREISSDEERLLSFAFYGIERARIGTIHSFCHSALSISPNINRDFFRSEIVEETKLSELAEQSIGKVVDNLSADELNSMFAARFKLFELKRGLSSLIRHAPKLDRLKETYFAPEKKQAELINQLVAHHRAAILASARELHSYLSQWTAQVGAWLTSGVSLKDDQLANFETLLSLAQGAAASYDSEEVTPEFCSAYTELMKFAEKNRSSHKTVSPKNPVNYWKDLRENLKVYKARLIVTQSLQKLEQDLFNLSRWIVSLAEKAAENLYGVKVANGVASFDDVINAVHRFSVSDNPYHSILQASTKHILIDEFQDTDAAQWEIFSRLKPETMFIVGDYQQAIYGFRGGEISVFDLAERELLKAGGELISLDDNYRSRPGVINFVNGFFHDLFRADGIETVTGRAMQPVRTDSEDELDGTFIIDRTNSRNLLEAKNTAEIVEALLERRPNGEIAVIARTGFQIRMLCGALTRANISYVVLHSGDFYEREEIKLFQNLFSWLARPEDNVALVGVLRSALIGLSDDELLQEFCSADRSWSGLHGSERLQSLARSQSAMELIDVALSEFKLHQTYTQIGDDAALANIRLLQLQLIEAAKAGLNVYSPLAVSSWFKRRPAISKDAVAAVREGAQVKILTIHGAKGLEFSNVVLPFLERKNWRPYDFVLGEFGGMQLLGLRTADDEGQVRTKSLTQQLLDDQNIQKERAEERRVFYVACTRARDTLVLNAAFAEKPSPPEEALTACAKSFNPAVWIKQLVQPGEIVSLNEAVQLHRAQPINLELSSPKTP